MGLGLLARALGDIDETNMSQVPHPPSGIFLHPWFDHLKLRPKMAPKLGGCRDGSQAIGPPHGDETNMSHVLIHLVEHFCALGLTT